MERSQKLIEELAEKVAQLEIKVDNLAKSTEGISELWKESVTAFKFFNRLMTAVRWFVRIILAPFMVLALAWQLIFKGADISKLWELLK